MSPDFNITSYTAAISGVAVVLALDMLVVAGRHYVRWKLKQRLNLSDWLVAPALVRQDFLKELIKAEKRVGLKHWHGSSTFRRRAKGYSLQPNCNGASRTTTAGQDLIGLRDYQEGTFGSNDS
jgi:hypothetical protein